METLSGENTDKDFKAMDDENKTLMRRDTWEIFLRESVADQNVLPGTWYLSARGNLIRKPGNLRHIIV